MTTTWGKNIRPTPHRVPSRQLPKHRFALRQRTLTRALAVALAASAGCALLLPAPAEAQAPAAQRQVYHIPAGPLGKALDSLGAQGNIQLVYAPNLIEGKTSPGLSGSFGPRDALGHILRGTHLTGRAVGAGTYVLKPKKPSRAQADPSDPPQAQPAQTTKKKKKKPKIKSLAPIRVSGSLINNAQVQTAMPTFTITSAEIEAQGLTSLDQVMQNSVLATGSVQGPSHSSSFTQGAETFSLDGLPPGFTLVLIDGRPLAPFGELYNGDTTFNNISNLPVSMISHIDIMPGGSSSIYGSSAMAGVVNIITKSNVNGIQFTGSSKGYGRGGHAERKFTLTFGHTFGKLHAMGSLHFSGQNPFWAFQRTRTRSTLQDPVPPGVSTALGEVFDYGTKGKHVESYVPAPDHCAAMQPLYNGTTAETNNAGDPNRGGSYCGSYFEEGFRTLAPKKKHYDGMFKFTYDLNSTTRLYADLMEDYEKERYVADPPHWDTDHMAASLGLDGGKLVDASTGHVIRFYKRFAPEELPGGMFGPARAYTQKNTVTNFVFGANGQFGGSSWLWNANYQHAGDRTVYNKPLWLSSVVNEFFQKKFLGPKLGTAPATGLPIFNPNIQAFFTPVTPAESAAMIYNNHGLAKSWINDTRLVINNPSLFSLPGGDAGVAVLAEFGNQAWYEPADPNLAAGLVWGHAATSGGGRRRHKAVAAEFNAPFFNWVTLDVSGREDRYKTDAASQHKFTWRGGIQFRPLSTLLVRASYATSFKAPDMPGLFLGPSTSFENQDDDLLCAQANGGVLPNNCDDFQDSVLVSHAANPKLKPETGKSWDAGVVWAPLNGFSVHLDYMRIKISNETILQSVGNLIFNQYRCSVGQLPAGDPDCVEANAQIHRDPLSNNITGIDALYDNLSWQLVDTIFGGISYHLHTHSFGTFDLRLAYNDQVKAKHQDRPGSVVENDLRNPEENNGFKSRATGMVTWMLPGKRHFRTTLFARREGALPNHAAQDHGWDADGAGRLAPYMTYNLGFAMDAVKHLRVSLHIDNLFNKLPPIDVTNDDYPYYFVDNYNVLGRSIQFRFDWKFGEI